MKNIMEIRLGNDPPAGNVKVVAILARPGLLIDLDQPVAILEGAEGTFEYGSPCQGRVHEVAVREGDFVSAEDLLLTVIPYASLPDSHPDAPPSSSQTISATTRNNPQIPEHAELVVIGGGPGGYTAAFRAADLGIRTVLVERHADLGGVCLNVGCIPSKSLLNLAKIIDETKAAAGWGLNFGAPGIDLEGIRSWKSKVVKQLNRGLARLAEKRAVAIVRGSASFISSKSLEIRDGDTVREMTFEHAIIAAGSRPRSIDGFPKDPRIMTSSGALLLQDIPEQFLVIGGGVVGMELATAYHGFGSQITVVEPNDQLIWTADTDLVKPLFTHYSSRFKNIHLGTRVERLVARDSGITAEFSSSRPIEPAEFDRVLLAVGRIPNSDRLSLENAAVETDDAGFITVDAQQRTNIPHILAVGDIAGNPMLAHKATCEGRIAAETIAGLAATEHTRIIPVVAYTDPEIAWVGQTEKELQVQGVEFEKTTFPWVASGRSLTMGRSEGLTKIIFDPQSDTILGAGIVGTNASELIAEMGLSIETGCRAGDLTHLIHPHPTLSESLSMAAEIFEGTITDLYIPRSRSVHRN